MSTIQLEYHENDKGKVEKKFLEFSRILLQEPYSVDSLFVIKVEGKSMEPKINDQALVIADLSQKDFIHDAIYLVYYEDKMWIKQAKELEGEKLFVSINPLFKHLVYQREEVRVIAKALLTFTTL
ncbi:MAG: S24 family peptidase [Arcobacteraceae bacterium]|jgi:phage repressor protein C with HTH and peptisase S24 domain|nr:S24 family peptidase [Arcobacteraceae bacterium]